MIIPHSLHISAKGDNEILIMRDFDAPRHLVFAAHTKPELLKRWLGVRSGWILAICEIDLRVGGAYRYVWRKESIGKDMGSGGIYREIIAPERIVCTEQFDDPWYPGEGLITTLFIGEGNQTTLSIHLRYETTEVRDAVLRSPMRSGLEDGYNNLAALLTILE